MIAIALGIISDGFKLQQKELQKELHLSRSTLDRLKNSDSHPRTHTMASFWKLTNHYVDRSDALEPYLRVEFLNRLIQAISDFPDSIQRSALLNKLEDRSRSVTTGSETK